MERVAALAWQDDAGGYAFSVADILRMSFDEMDEYLDIAFKKRKARADAIKRAQEKPKRKR